MSNLSKYQKFEVKNIKRCEIKNAPYNPRIIEEQNKKKLKDNLRKVGLLSTLVVNKQTMNLVSGHQRLSILDSLEKNDQYELTVSLVSLSEKEEKKQNIFFNNKNTQGVYDIELLTAISEEIDLTECGFNDSEISFMVGEKLIDENKATKEEEYIFENINKIKEAKKNIKDKYKNEDGENFVVIMFKTIHEKNDFLLSNGIEEDTKYFEFKSFCKMIK